jgi:hypothetical protein
MTNAWQMARQLADTIQYGDGIEIFRHGSRCYRFIRLQGQTCSTIILYDLLPWGLADIHTDDYRTIYQEYKKEDTRLNVYLLIT